MKPLQFALLNLSRKKTPTLITVIFIAISIACSGVLLRLNQVSTDRFATMARGGDAIVAAKAGTTSVILNLLNGEGPYPSFIPYNLFLTLKSQTTNTFEDGKQITPSIVSITPFVYFAKIGPYRVIGTDDSFLHRPVGEESPQLSRGQWAVLDGQVVIGSQVAKDLNLQTEATIKAPLWAGSDLQNETVELKVVGILKEDHSTWDRSLFTNLSTAHQNLARLDLSKKSTWGHNVLHYYLVYLNPDGLKDLSKLVNDRTVAQAISIPEQKAELAALTNSGAAVGLTVSILILVLSTLGVTAMLVTRFESMALQLAVLRAIGYKKSTIARSLLWEGFLLGVCGCAIGALMDFIFFPGMRHLLGPALPPPEIVSSSLWQSFPIWIAAILATTASISIPLLRLYRQNVHFSLRD